MSSPDQPRSSVSGRERDCSNSGNVGRDEFSGCLRTEGASYDLCFALDRMSQVQYGQCGGKVLLTSIQSSVCRFPQGIQEEEGDDNHCPLV